MSYIEVERKIYLSDNIFKNEYDYMFGEYENDRVIQVTYYKEKDDYSKTINKKFTLKEAIEFARYRMRDRRYKNYQIIIDKL